MAETLLKCTTRHVRLFTARVEDNNLVQDPEQLTLDLDPDNEFIWNDSSIALVQKPDYVSLYQQLGIDTAVSPRLLCANRILAFVRSRSISTIASIEEGKAEVLELEIGPGSSLVGKVVQNAQFPAGCVVAAIRLC